MQARSLDKGEVGEGTTVHVEALVHERNLRERGATCGADEDRERQALVTRLADGHGPEGARTVEETLVHRERAQVEREA